MKSKVQNLTDRQTDIHWYGIDLIKGLLIISVFLGHAIPGVLRETYPRYIIYSFHMPLFIGISGFLIDIEKLSKLKFIDVLKKYLKRLGVPWFIAVIIFVVINNIYNLSNISIKTIIHAYCYPYYHLWYILGIASYILISYILFSVLRNNKYRWLIFLGITSAISFVSKWGLLNGKLDNTYVNLLYDCIHHDFRLYNLLFFSIGLLFRNRYKYTKNIATDNIAEILRVGSIISSVIVCILFFFSYGHAERAMYYVMNICLLITIYFDCTNKQLPRCKTIEFIGKYSLPIYLYHVLCLNVADLFFSRGSIENYSICIGTFIIGCVLIYPFRNVRFINKIIFGN